MTDRLNKALADNPADPAPNEPTSTAPPDPAAGNPGSTDGDGKPKERTVENVYGELTRKLEKQAAQYEAQIAELRGTISGLQANPAPVAAPANSPNTLDDMSIEQLDAFRAQVPEDKLPAFNSYYNDRVLNDKVASAVAEKVGAIESRQQQSNSDSTALARWPQLRDKSSLFARRVDQKLVEMGSRADTDPDAILHAANEIGLSMGLVGTPTRGTPANLATGDDTAPPAPSKNEEEELDPKIVAALQQSMPGKTFTKEQLERIKKNTKLYKDNIDLFVK